MNWGGSDFESDIEDIRDLHKPYKIGDKIDNSSIKDTKSIPTIINYAHIDLTNSKYGFGQIEFDNNDAVQYLSRMQTLCSKSIFSIKDKESSQEWHLNQTKGLNIKQAIDTHFNIRNKTVNYPEIFHFALYHKENQPPLADRTKGIKNPRIHFIVGNHGIIYPLFYDPYHEMNP